MIIALYSPRPQSGKTSAAQYLRRTYNFQPVSLANPMKKMLETLLVEAGYSLAEAWEFLWGNKKEEPIPLLGGHSGRHLMTTLGTEWGRECNDEDFWVRLAVRKIRSCPHSHVVIDDMRRDNEFQALKDLGAILVKVFRGQSLIPNSHKSEGELNHHPFDFEISNNSDIELLYGKMDSIVKQESKSLFH